MSLACCFGEAIYHFCLVFGVYLLATFVQTLYASIFRPGKDLKKFGDWAVVTGATDGIGKQVAKELARKGLNLVLISRTQSKLDACAQEISEEHGVQVETVAVDFSCFSDADTEAVTKAVAGRNVAVLYNNVGCSYAYASYYDEWSHDEEKFMNRLNIESVQNMTRICLPDMLSRRSGAIVNVSSGFAVFPAPLYAGYGASKQYVAKLSECLNQEYASKGVHVQCQVPFLVATKLSKIRRPTIVAPTPAAFAKAAVRAIGYEAVSTPYWSHALQSWMAAYVLPKKVVEMIAMKNHQAIRTRALRKMAKNQ